MTKQTSKQKHSITWTVTTNAITTIDLNNNNSITPPPTPPELPRIAQHLIVPHSAPYDSIHKNFDLITNFGKRRAESVSLPLDPQVIKEAGIRLRTLSEEFDKSR